MCVGRQIVVKSNRIEICVEVEREERSAYRAVGLFLEQLAGAGAVAVARYSAQRTVLGWHRPARTLLLVPAAEAGSRIPCTFVPG